MLQDDQLTAARQSGFDTLCGMLNLTMNSMERIVSLNLELSKSTFDTLQQHTLDACVKKEPQQLVDLGRDLNEQVVKGAQNYNSALMELMAALQSQFTAALQNQSEMPGGAFQSMAGNFFRFPLPMQLAGMPSDATLGSLQERVRDTGEESVDALASKSVRRALDAVPAPKRSS